MENIPTAKAWLEFFEENAYPGTSISEAMIEFTKMHVKEALREASEKVILVYLPPTHIENEDEVCKIYIPSILNAYPLDNIK